MSNTVLTIVLSQGQGRNPEKRALEEAITAAASAWPDVTVLVIPHLYDLTAAGPSVKQLRQIQGPLVLLSWLFERAGHWVLDRLEVRGQLLPTELTAEDDEDDEEDTDQASVSDEAIPSGRSARPMYSIDLRVSQKADEYIVELARLVEYHRQNHSQQNTTNDSHVSNGHASKPAAFSLSELLTDQSDSVVSTARPTEDETAIAVDGALVRVTEHPTRRWYPVIDFSRCTNCMECIDFCLFGVYGVDGAENILVEQPDNCRKGCPACSRVCPANAIIFPQHKTPAIAGAAGDNGSFRIDLSKLFGAVEDEDPAAVAARERDEQLLLAGRAAVGGSDDQQTSQPRTTSIVRASWSATNDPHDGLDNLIDELDSLDL